MEMKTMNELYYYLIASLVISVGAFAFAFGFIPGSKATIKQSENCPCRKINPVWRKCFLEKRI